MVRAADLGSINKNSLAISESYQILAEVGSTADMTYTPVFTKEESMGIGLIILGALLVPFSLLLLWHNERRAVKNGQIVDQARFSCISVDADRPLQNNLFKLVHLSGVTSNMTNL